MRDRPEGESVGFIVDGVTNLHEPDRNVTILHRLLWRSDSNGALVPADRALIELAIVAGYEELVRMRALLATIPNDPAASWRQTADELDVAASKLEGLLGVLEAELNRNEG